jgi:dihydroflavonol-4-reductase
MALAEILAELGAILDRPAPRVRLPYFVAYAAGAISTGLAALTRRPPAIALEAVKMSRRRMYFDPGKAVRDLGLPQTPVRAAFEDALAWFAQRGYIPGGGRKVEWASR